MDLVQQLAKAGITVTAASESTYEAVIRTAPVCLFNVGNESLDAAFFATPEAAASVRVCESQVGDRYMYQVNGRSIDAAYRLYWTVSGSRLVWTSSPGLSDKILRGLGGSAPTCTP